MTPSITKVYQLYSRRNTPLSAQIIETPNGHKTLISYNSVIFEVDENHNLLYLSDKWDYSKTTTSHINKAIDFLNESKQMDLAPLTNAQRKAALKRFYRKQEK